MKKLYFIFFAFVFTVSTFGQSAIFQDYFDGYTVGQKLACQNPDNWTTWSNAPCGTEDPVISNAQSSSVSNSVLITPNIDLVKTLPNFTTGSYSVVFRFYIATGKTGYFNLLHLFAGGSSNWAFEAYLNGDGTGYINAGGANAATFNYPMNAWNTVEVRANMAGTSDVGSFYLNGTNLHTWIWSAGATGSGGIKQLGGVNFFGAAATEEMYVDNFQIWDNIIPVELSSFTAAAGDGQVTLNWTTASELNNRGFEVQRKSENGQYVTLGFVQGMGTTTETQNYSFSDKSAVEGKMFYRLKQVDFDGRFEYSNELEVDAIGDVSFALNQNYPNPFNPSTRITFSLPEPGIIRLAVYNLIGEEVASLVNEHKEAGTYEVNFDAGSLPSGTYFYKLQTGNSILAKKMILTR